MLKYVRIAVTALSLTACVLLIALWVRSYWRSDICGLTFDSEKRWNFCSAEGRVFLTLPDCESAIWAIGKSREWDIRSEYVGYVSHQNDPYFRLNYGGGVYWVIVPHLIFVVFAVPLTAAPWIPWRFSLRTLLIATTLVAVGLGMLAFKLNQPEQPLIDQRWFQERWRE